MGDLHGHARGCRFAHHGVFLLCNTSTRTTFQHSRSTSTQQTATFPINLHTQLSQPTLQQPMKTRPYLIMPAPLQPRRPVLHIQPKPNRLRRRPPKNRMHKNRLQRAPSNLQNPTPHLPVRAVPRPRRPALLEDHGKVVQVAPPPTLRRQLFLVPARELLDRSGRAMSRAGGYPRVCRECGLGRGRGREHRGERARPGRTYRQGYSFMNGGKPGYIG